MWGGGNSYNSFNDSPYGRPENYCLLDVLSLKFDAP